MLLTEDEAEKRWCPFADRVGRHGFPTCLGSGCMAWRWSFPDRALREEGDEPRGYCGLASADPSRAPARR
jgi:hypothetical protein